MEFDTNTQRKLSWMVPVVLLATLPLPADTLSHTTEPTQAYKQTDNNLTMYTAAENIKWELAAVTAGVVGVGLYSWNWGSSNSFKFNSEGWFGTDTGSAGADKLGHLYSSYLMNDFFNKQMLKETNDITGAAQYSALFSGSIMLFIEVLDGYSVDHGFSYEDLIADGIGIGISYLKNTIPELDNKLDLRVEYSPTEAYSNHPITDYSGYNYSAVLRLDGFETLKETPMKYFELMVGYHAEGFKRNEEKYFEVKQTQLYLGIGLNLTEIFFKPIKQYTDSPAVDYVDTFFHYYQAPNIYVSSTVQERVVPY